MTKKLFKIEGVDMLTFDRTFDAFKYKQMLVFEQQ